MPRRSARAVPAELIVGVDVGTTSIKAVAFDAITGESISSATADHRTYFDRPGWSEQEPADWMVGLEAVWNRVTANNHRRVAAIGIVSQVNTHVFVDAELEPVGRAIVWNDIRSADVADELNEVFVTRIDASHAASRWAWLNRVDRDLASGVRWILSPKDYCIAQLTGVVGTDPISSIGLVDSKGHYIDELNRLTGGLVDRLPPLRAFDALAGMTNGTWGLPSGVPVAIGTMDAWGSVFGSGVTVSGDGLQVSGTSEIVGLMSDSPGGALGVVSFPPVRGRYLHAGPSQAGGQALRWAADLFSMSIEDALVAASQATDERIVFLPHLLGERAPVWNPNARGVWIGMTTASGTGEMIRAVLEGVAFSARWIREVCEEAAGRPARSLRISGGGSQSRYWNEIKASAHELPLEVVDCLDSGCLGAAIMGAVAAQLTDEDIDEWAGRVVVVKETVLPEESQSRRLEELYSVYRSTYSALGVVFDVVAKERP